MSTSRLRMVALAGLAVIVLSCAQDTQEPREAGGKDAIRARLEALADAHYGERPHATWVADSSASAVVPGLTYHWIIVHGNTFRDGRNFTLVSVGGRQFSADNLAGWSPLFGAWQPEDANEALSFCAEAALVTAGGMLHQLGDPTSLTLDAALPRASEQTRRYLTRAVNDTEVFPPSGGRTAWEVRYWYLDGLPNRHRPLATRFRCLIPTDARPLRIEIVDSIKP